MVNPTNKNLECTLLLNFFEKIQAILLYWFAAQQQTSKHRQKKIDWYDVKLGYKKIDWYG